MGSQLGAQLVGVAGVTAAMRSRCRGRRSRRDRFCEPQCGGSLSARSRSRSLRSKPMCPAPPTMTALAYISSTPQAKRSEAARATAAARVRGATTATPAPSSRAARPRRGIAWTWTIRSTATAATRAAARTARRRRRRRRRQRRQRRRAAAVGWWRSGCRSARPTARSSTRACGRRRAIRRAARDLDAAAPTTEGARRPPRAPPAARAPAPRSTGPPRAVVSVTSSSPGILAMKPGSYTLGPDSTIEVHLVLGPDAGAMAIGTHVSVTLTVAAGSEEPQEVVVDVYSPRQPIDDVGSCALAASTRREDTWTHLVYMHADNDLESPMLDDVREMADAFKDDDGAVLLNLIVLLDRAHDDGRIKRTDGAYDPRSLLEDGRDAPRQHRHVRRHRVPGHAVGEHAAAARRSRGRRRAAGGCSSSGRRRRTWTTRRRSPASSPRGSATSGRQVHGQPERPRRLVDRLRRRLLAHDRPPRQRGRDNGAEANSFFYLDAMRDAIKAGMAAGFTQQGDPTPEARRSTSSASTRA